MKLIQTCPSCGGFDWSCVDDKFKCSACGCVCYADEMRPSLLEVVQPIRRLSTRLVLLDEASELSREKWQGIVDTVKMRREKRGD